MDKLIDRIQTDFERSLIGPTGVERGDKLVDQEDPLPIKFDLTLVANASDDSVAMFFDNRQIGLELQDQVHDSDDFRYHDVFHAVFAAVLGWSPVLRLLMGFRREGNFETLLIDDGNRAIIVEEAIVELVICTYRRYGKLDQSQLANLASNAMLLTAQLEVSSVSEQRWYDALSTGVSLWLEVKELSSCRLTIDRQKQSVSHLGLRKSR